MDLNLKGRTALVTGSSRGIGFAIARLFAAEGCHLHLVSRTAADLESARQQIIAVYSVNVACHALDLSISEDAVKLTRACGEVDILVNNAGAIPRGTMTDLDEKTWRSALDLKLFGFINVVREIYRRMCERRHGVIINVIGTVGEQPTSAHVAGSTANAGLMALSRALGAESPAYNVRVIGINPGATETGLQVERLRARAEKELGSAERWRELTAGLPFGRLATPDEVASVTVFLASDQASYVTGTIVTVDGGAAWKK